MNTFGQNTRLLQSLVDKDVEFLVVGGLAVKYYCEDREVDDLDILINPTAENAERVINALSTIGLNAPFESNYLTKPKAQIPLKRIYYADIVTPESGISFDIVSEDAVFTGINEVQVRIPSKENLIIIKSTGREKDEADILLLNK